VLIEVINCTLKPTNSILKECILHVSLVFDVLYVMFFHIKPSTTVIVGIQKGNPILHSDLSEIMCVLSGSLT